LLERLATGGVLGVEALGLTTVLGTLGLHGVFGALLLLGVLGALLLLGVLHPTAGASVLAGVLLGVLHLTGVLGLEVDSPPAGVVLTYVCRASKFFRTALLR
jgi:hypothetical protein